MIRELLRDNNLDWYVDKHGIKTTKYIIEPIIEYIEPLVRKFIQNHNVNYRKLRAIDAEIEVGKLKTATKILQDIDDKILSADILKYIAPYFYLARNEKPIQQII